MFGVLIKTSMASIESRIDVRVALSKKFLVCCLYDWYCFKYFIQVSFVATVGAIFLKSTFKLNVPRVELCH